MPESTNMLGFMGSSVNKMDRIEFMTHQSMITQGQ